MQSSQGAQIVAESAAGVETSWSYTRIGNVEPRRVGTPPQSGNVATCGPGGRKRYRLDRPWRTAS